MKLIYSAMMFLLGALFCSAQTFSLTGTVRDFHDKTVLPEAKIKIANFETTTNSEGKFSIRKIPQGNYTITVTHDECAPFNQDIDLYKDVHVEIQLEHHVGEIETVNIHGTHKNTGTMVVKTLEKTDIERNSTENLGNLLTNVSGVSALKTGNNISKPIIHGLYGSRISIINNGVKLAEQEWGVEHAPNVEITNFQHIDVIKGASALKYGGDAVGGVVVLEPEIFPRKDGMSGSMNFTGNSNGKGVGIEANVLKTWENGWTVKSNATFRITGDLQAPDYGLMNTGMEQNTFAFTVQNNSFLKGISFDYYLTNQQLGILRDSHVGSLQDFYNIINSDKPFYTRDFSYDVDNPKQDVQHHIAKISA